MFARTAIAERVTRGAGVCACAGLSDGQELASNGDPLAADADDDGLSDAVERLALGTDPRAADTDGDGLPDGAEVDVGTDPRRADSDADGLADGVEAAWGTDPTAADTDADALTDGGEVVAGSDPRVADTDGDGASDGVEVSRGTSPVNLAPEVTILMRGGVDDVPGGFSLVEGAPLSVQVQTADGDHPADALRVTLSAEGYGELAIATPDSQGIASFEGVLLAVGTHLITATVTDPAGDDGVDVIDAVVIHPDAYVFEDYGLTCVDNVGRLTATVTAPIGPNRLFYMVDSRYTKDYASLWTGSMLHAYVDGFDGKIDTTFTFWDGGVSDTFFECEDVTEARLAVTMGLYAADESGVAADCVLWGLAPTAIANRTLEVAPSVDIPVVLGPDCYLDTRWER